MAVVRARSTPPYGLITFVALWVLTTGLAVFFYVQWNAAAKEKQDSDAMLNRISGNGDASNASKLFQPQAGSSLLGSANEQYQLLHTLLSASPNATAADIKREADAALAASGKAAPMIDAMKQLNSELQSKSEQLAALTKQVETLKTQTAAAVKEADDRVAQANTSLKELQDKLVAGQDTSKQAQDTFDTTIKGKEDEITKLTDARVDAERHANLVQEDLNKEIASLHGQIEELKLRVNAAQGKDNTIVGEPDGRIARANTAAGEVYINLGKAQRVTPGLTFTVYDPRMGVRFGSTEDAMGKASIEVTEVYDQSSLCRITRTTRGQSIQSGDLISNVVYHNDKSRKYHFVIFGNFDLDGDGVSTAHERERLVRMIIAWGGIIDDQVTSQTDYLVVGERPPAPEITTPDADASGSVSTQRSMEQDKYDELVNNAKKLSIPVLNANRFLAMIGYYNTTIVR